MRFKTLTLATASLLAVVAAPSNAAKPFYGDWGYDRSAMDSSVKPGDDFWAFVNGDWDKKTQIAADRASAGPFVTLSDGAERDVRQIVEQLAADQSRDHLGQQIGDYYSSFTDTGAIEAAGTAPLKPYLAEINGAKTRAQLLSLFIKPGYASPVDVGIGPNFKNPDVYAVFAGQARLGMPSREYYLEDNAKMQAHRAAYRNYIVSIEKLAGLPDPEGAADRIIKLETDLSKVQWTAADRRDIDKIYNPMTRAQLIKLAPQFDWNATLAKGGLANAKTVIVTEPSAVAGAGKILASAPLSTWKEWLAFRFISDHATVLPKAFDDARFAFYSKELSGVQAQRERWKRGVAAVNNALGEGVGQIYVKSHFPATSEAQMHELIGNLEEAYRDRISNNKWMDEATRKAALEKLAAFEPRIGHPVKYIDYSSMNVVKGDPLGNELRAADFQWKLDLKRFPKPVDRTLWGMFPQTINAYYNPLANQITFPAAILQPPFFDPNADPAVNYGAIGAVIGHEMGHGFDNEGRKFDPKGKLRDWWSPEAAKSFTTRTDALVAQYNGFKPFPDLAVNGKLTLGENIGDLSGVEAAYAAYQKYTAKHGQPPVIDGLTGDQRFFIAYAQAWQEKQREDAERQQVITNEHSPGRYRVNGVVRNVDAWYKAFNVQPGDKLYLPPEQRVHIW
ncbi:M13 family metallopeptidase [Sphingomonas agri]|uniref:M13 family metallopeptidase n=1 Tax=Sphingomonas agri TaxID=1813878 RepID=UPI00311DEFDA